MWNTGLVSVALIGLGYALHTNTIMRSHPFASEGESKMSIPVEVQEVANESWRTIVSVHVGNEHMDETMRDFFENYPNGTALQFFEDWNSHGSMGIEESVQEDAWMFLERRGYSEEDAAKLSQPDGEYTNYFREAYRNAAKQTDATSWVRETQKWR